MTETSVVCSPTKPPDSGDSSADIDINGLARHYLLHVPSGYDGARGVALVLNLHGLGSSGEEQARYSRLPAKADEEGFVLVSPDGTGSPRGWDFLGKAGVDGDVALFNQLLDRLESDLCVDAGRVYAAGISNGALESERLGCVMPQRIAAIATVATTVFLPGCIDGPPVAVISFHGTADTYVPFKGGTSIVNVPVPPAEDGTRGWAQHNGCSVEPTTGSATEHVSILNYGGCRDGSDVVLYIVEGGGHTWPGAVDVPRLGATTQEIRATDTLWAFFASHSRAGP